MENNISVLFVKDDKERTIILNTSDSREKNLSDMKTDDIKPSYETKTSIISKNFFDALSQSKYINYPIKKDLSLKIPSGSTLIDIFKNIVDFISDDNVINIQESLRDSNLYIDIFLEILSHKLMKETEERKKFINSFYEISGEYFTKIFRLRSKHVVSPLDVLKHLLSEELSQMNYDFEDRSDYSLMSILRGDRLLEDKNDKYDFLFIKKIMEMFDVVAKEGVYISRSNPYVVEKMIIRNSTEIIGDKKFSESIFNYLSEMFSTFSYKNIEDLINIDDARYLDFLKIINPENSNRIYEKNPIIVLETFRRGLELKDNFSKDTLNLTIEGIMEKLPTWPIFYNKEVNLVIDKILKDISEYEIERVFYIISRYKQIFSEEKIFEFVFKNRHEMVKNLPYFKGKSESYCMLILRNRISTSGSYTLKSFLTDLDTYRNKLLFSGTTGSIYLKIFSTIKSFERGNNVLAESLLRELYSDLFKSLVASNKSERNNFMKIIPHFMSRKQPNRESDLEQTELELKVKVFFEEMSKSQLKNVTIEKIIDSEGSETHRYYQRNRNLFGKSYMEISTMLQGCDIRPIINTTLLRMELN